LPQEKEYDEMIHMQMTRRSWLLTTAASLPCARAAAAAPLLYIGAYTNEKNKGIQVAKFDPATGALADLKLAAETPNPTFLTLHPSQKFLFAINEIGNFEGQRAGSVCSFAVDRATGLLQPLSRVSAKGPGPCHVSTDLTGAMLMIANYGGGSVASYRIGSDGRLSEAVSFFQHEGKGAVARRQEGPHAHCVYPSPGNRWAVSCDLGTNEVHVYSIDPKTATMKPASKVMMREGAGPRHFAWHPNGKFGYVINELNSTVTACRWDEAKGELTPLASVTTLPADYPPGNSTAEVRVHPSGRWLYGSNRGKDDIVGFAVEPDGSLRLMQAISTQGQVPRNFNLDPEGRWLLAANQKSDNIVVFAVDAKTGRLAPAGQGITVGSPVCLRWVV
jgi:6-phosphogluconolactonase